MVGWKCKLVFYSQRQFSVIFLKRTSALRKKCGQLTSTIKSKFSKTKMEVKSSNNTQATYLHSLSKSCYPPPQKACQKVAIHPHRKKERRYTKSRCPLNLVLKWGGRGNFSVCTWIIIFTDLFEGELWNVALCWTAKSYIFLVNVNKVGAHSKTLSILGSVQPNFYRKSYWIGQPRSDISASILVRVRRSTWNQLQLKGN